MLLQLLTLFELFGIAHPQGQDCRVKPQSEITR